MANQAVLDHYQLYTLLTSLQYQKYAILVHLVPIISQGGGQPSSPDHYQLYPYSIPHYCTIQITQRGGQAGSLRSLSQVIERQGSRGITGITDVTGITAITVGDVTGPLESQVSQVL